MDPDLPIFCKSGDTGEIKLGLKGFHLAGKWPVLTTEPSINTQRKPVDLLIAGFFFLGKFKNNNLRIEQPRTFVSLAKASWK